MQQQAIPIQFAFEYEVTIVDEVSGEEKVMTIYTTMKNKDSLKGPNVKSIKLKQTKEDDRSN